MFAPKHSEATLRVRSLQLHRRCITARLSVWTVNDSLAPIWLFIVHPSLPLDPIASILLLTVQYGIAVRQRLILCELHRVYRGFHTQSSIAADDVDTSILFCGNFILADAECNCLLAHGVQGFIAKRLLLFTTRAMIFGLTVIYFTMICLSHVEDHFAVSPRAALFLFVVVVVVVFFFHAAR